MRIEEWLQDAETLAAEAKATTKDYYKILGALHSFTYTFSILPMLIIMGNRVDIGLHASSDPQCISTRVAQAPS